MKKLTLIFILFFFVFKTDAQFSANSISFGAGLCFDKTGKSISIKHVAPEISIKHSLKKDFFVQTNFNSWLKDGISFRIGRYYFGPGNDSFSVIDGRSNFKSIGLGFGKSLSLKKNKTLSFQAGLSYKWGHYNFYHDSTYFTNDGGCTLISNGYFVEYHNKVSHWAPFCKVSFDKPILKNKFFIGTSLSANYLIGMKNYGTSSSLMFNYVSAMPSPWEINFNFHCGFKF